MKNNGTNREQEIILQGDLVAVEIVTKVRREEALLKAGALQNAIFNSANFSSIATDARGSPGWKRNSQFRQASGA